MLYPAKICVVMAALALLLGLAQEKRDPAAWGGSHAGRPVPEYITGDECLFCHRNTIGPLWQQNAHNLTVRDRQDAPDLDAIVKTQPALAREVEYFLGSRHHLRFLKKSGYNRFTIASARAALAGDRRVERWEGVSPLTFDRDRFADRCAGCHTTGFDSQAKTFSAFGLDCYTCHGVVDLKHSTDTSLVWLSKKKRSDAQAITSTCAQCHLRGGRSRSTGLPFPNNFVVGDNLFKDYQVDWSRADDPALNAGDRHVWRNARDVALYGQESVTCLSCHQVHANSTRRHRIVLKAPICADCHDEGSYKKLKPYTVHSETCEY